MNFSSYHSISIYDSSTSKSTFPLSNSPLTSASSLNSLPSDQMSQRFNISTGNQTYAIRKLKSLAISCDISQTPLFEKVLSTLDNLKKDLNDSALLDFCDFFSFCYKIVPREVISRIISVFQNHQFSANSLIVISYVIKDFQNSPYDENSTQFFQNFINNSFLQLRKILLSSSLNNSNETEEQNSLNNSSFFNLEKFSNCCTFCIVDSPNFESFLNQEDEFELSNVDDSSLFLDNHNYNDVILFENDDNGNHTTNNPNNDPSNSRCTFTQQDTRNNSFLNQNNNNNSNDSNISNCDQTYKLFNCDFTHEKILQFLLYLLHSKEMQGITPMCNSFIDFANILASQYENRNELAKFANYMISLGKINMVPKDLFLNNDFFELAERGSIIEVLKIISAEDINNNTLLFTTILNSFNESDIIVTFLKRCNELNFTLAASFLKEIAISNEELLPSEENNQEINYDYVLTDIINKIEPIEFNLTFLNYLSRYKFKLNSAISSKLPSILGSNIFNSSIISFEYLIQIMDSPLKYLDPELFIPFLYNCTNPDVFNSITNNYPTNKDEEIIIHPLFQSPKFWTRLISIFEFNSIQYFAKIFISNNPEDTRGQLIARIFLENYPNNFKGSFFFFAKITLLESRDLFSTCPETKELISNCGFFCPRQFWRLFSTTKLIIEIVHSVCSSFLYDQLLLALTLIQISMYEESGRSPNDPLIQDLYFPNPPTIPLITAIAEYFKNNDDFFNIENQTEQTIRVLSIGHYFFSTLIFRHKQININNNHPIYCIISLIIIIYDLKRFKKASFSQNKSIINSLLNTQKYMKMIKLAFEMNVKEKDPLIDVFLQSFGSKDDNDYVLNINDNSLKWVKFVFDNNSLLAPNLYYSKSLSHFFGQLTLCVNAFNCPITSQFIYSKFDKLILLFYYHSSQFFTLNTEMVDRFIRQRLMTERITFQFINFVMSCLSPSGKCFQFPKLDLTPIIMPFIEQNQISKIKTIFDFSNIYMDLSVNISLFKIPKLPIEIRASYSWLFKYLTIEDFRQLFSPDYLVELINHTDSISFINTAYKAIEGCLDDDETISNRSTYIAQVKKKYFTLGENFLFPNRIAIQQQYYNLNFLKGLYRVYEDSFVDYSNHILIERMNFIPLNKNSEYSNSYLNELIKTAVQSNSWQLFSILKSIANSHLFLFSNNDSENPVDLFCIFKYCIESINSINLNNLNDQFKLFLNCHAFLSFLILSPCIADAFFNWIFSRINQFNDNEFYLVLTFINNYLTSPITEIQMLAFCVKYNFVSLMIKMYQEANEKDNQNNTSSSILDTTIPLTNNLSANENQSHTNRNNPENNFLNDQMLFIDYEMFTVSDSENNVNDSDESIDTYMDSIRMEHNLHQTFATNTTTTTTNNNNNGNSNNDSDSIQKKNENALFNTEGMIKSSEKIKKQSYSLGLSIINIIESTLSSFYVKSNNLELIEFDELLKNSDCNPLYKGSYNECWSFSSFKPFSNSFPREISIPKFEPKPFTEYLTKLKSSLANLDLVQNITERKLLGEIDNTEITILINKLRDPYEKEPTNFNAPIEPIENENGLNFSTPTSSTTTTSFLHWNESIENNNTNYQPLYLKDLISIDPDEYEFLDEGGQAAVLRQNLPPLPNVNDPNIFRLLLKMPRWASNILSNSQVRAILPPCYLIELHRIISIINRPQKKIKQNKRNSKNNEIDYRIDINPCQFLCELQSRDGAIENKIEFIANLRSNKKFISLKNIKKICEVLLKSATLHDEEIMKKVFLVGNKYISNNPNVDTIICILSAFESMKTSKFFATHFESLSSLCVYEEVGRSCISNSEVALLGCSLFVGLGESINEIGIQFFEICLEVNDPKIFMCLDFIAQLPDKVKQKLTRFICHLIDDRKLIQNLDSDLNELNSNSSSSSLIIKKEDTSNKIKCTLSLIEKIVKNFPSIVQMRSARFLEILSCILSKGKYISVVGQIALILCPPKIPQNKLKATSSAPSNSSTNNTTSNSTQSLARNMSLPTRGPIVTPQISTNTAGILPTPILTSSSSTNAIGQRHRMIHQQNMQESNINNDPLKDIHLSISIDENEDNDGYGISYGIPNHIFNTSPEFWKVIGPSMPLFNKMIEKDLKAFQYELSFLKSYPEVLSFNCKLLLFHKIQCIQQMRQQKQLQREYHKSGGILTFNSVIMTINNSNSSSNGSSNNGSNSSTTTTTNSISFINGTSSQPIQSRSRNTNTTSSASISFGNTNSNSSHFRQVSSDSTQPFLSSSLQSQGCQTSFSITSRTVERSQSRPSRNSTSSNSSQNENENEEGRTNTSGINGGIIRPMIKVRRSHVLHDTYSVFGPAFSELGFNIMPVRDIFVRFTGEPGIDLGGLTKDWISSTIKELFNQDYYLFKQTTDGYSLFPNPSSSVNPDHLGYFELAGRIIAISLAKDINIDAHLALPFLKSLLEKKPNIKDLERVDSQVYNSLKWMKINEKVEDLDMYFVVDVERSLGIKETIDLVRNGKNIRVTDKNKNIFIEAMANYYLYSSIELQIGAFKKGFYSIIPLSLIEMFTPTELDLLISGNNIIDVEDMRTNCVYEKPYNKNHPVVELFFSCISKWNQEDLHLLLRFITGLAHVPIGGFASMAEKKKPLTISPGGDRERLPQAHTCFNRIDIPAYKNEKELNDKLLYSIRECDNFLLI